MINIRLKERQEAVLSTLEIKTTFKIPESSFIFMKVDVDGLTVRAKGNQSSSNEPVLEPIKEPVLEPIKVLIPEGKTTATCLNTGKVQFLNLKEIVQIVELEAVEITKEKGE